MKKRVLIFLSAMLLVASMSMTAFAAKSTEIDTNAYDKDGNSVDIIDGDDSDIDKEIKVDGKDYTLVDVIEIVAEEDEYPIIIEFDKEDWKNGAPIVYGYDETTGEWIRLEVIDDGDVYKVILQYPMKRIAVYDVKASVETDSNVPKTGDSTSFVWPLVAIVAAAAVIVAVVVNKKKKA